jgi:hypothetical protein
VWFDRLEEELEKMEVEDALLNVPKRLMEQPSSEKGSIDGAKNETNLSISKEKDKQSNELPPLNQDV